MEDQEKSKGKMAGKGREVKAGEWREQSEEGCTEQRWGEEWREESDGG